MVTKLNLNLKKIQFLRPGHEQILLTHYTVHLLSYIILDGLLKLRKLDNLEVYLLRDRIDIAATMYLKRYDTPKEESTSDMQMLSTMYVLLRKDANRVPVIHCCQPNRYNQYN